MRVSGGARVISIERTEREEASEESSGDIAEPGENDVYPPEETEHVEALPENGGEDEV